jgi:hypothetical protein
VWLRGSVGLLATQPLRLLVIGLVLQLLAGVSQAGILGLLFLMVMPVLSAGVLQAMRQAAHGERPGLMTLFAGFSVTSALGRLVALGALVVGVAVLAVALGLAGSLSNLDPNLLARLEAGDTNAVAELDPSVLRNALLALAAGMLLGGSLVFYAVPLIWFSGMTLWRAIWQGILGMVREWRALLVLGLLMGVLSFPVALSLAGLLVTGEDTSALLTLVALLVSVVFQLLLFAAQYQSWADIFGAPAPGKTIVADDQLVA